MDLDEIQFDLAEYNADPTEGWPSLTSNPTFKITILLFTSTMQSLWMN